MKRTRFLRGAVMAMACTNLVLPASAFAETPAKPAAVAQKLAISDVSLGEEGLLLGQVVDTQGAVLKNAPVMIMQNDKQIAVTQADAEGRFAVKGLRGGTYQIVTKDGVSMCRLWAHDTAPPSAQAGVLVCSGGTLRGQGPIMHWLTNPWVIAGLVATAIAVPIIIHNRDDDDDDRDSSS